MKTTDYRMRWCQIKACNENKFTDLNKNKIMIYKYYGINYLISDNNKFLIGVV